MAPGKTHTIIVSSKAQSMLEKHVEFLARVSVSAARKLAVEYRNAVKEIRKNPERYPFLDMPGVSPHTYRKCLFSRRYELIFLMIEKTIYIDTVRDCRQNPDDALS